MALRKFTTSILRILNLQGRTIQTVTIDPPHPRFSAILKHPLTKNIYRVGTIYAAADVTQQMIQRKGPYDVMSTVRMVAFGAGFLAPFYLVWYGLLDRLVVGTHLTAIARKLLVDQTIGGSTCIVAFYSSMALMEGKSCIDEVKERGPKTFMLGLMFWPLVQSINFRFLATQHRSLYVGCASFVWSNVLCVLKSS